MLTFHSSDELEIIYYCKVFTIYSLIKFKYLILSIIHTIISVYFYICRDVLNLSYLPVCQHPMLIIRLVSCP